MGNTQSSAPLGAQLNKLAVPLTCTVSGDTSSTSPIITHPVLELSTTAPINGSAGQRFFFSDLAGALTVSDIYTTQAQGFSNYDLDITVQLNNDNARPASYAIQQSVGIPTSQSRFTFASNYTQNRLGPIMLGFPGQNDLTLGEVDFRITYYTSGGQAGSHLDSVCTPSSPPDIISSVAIASPVSEVLAPSSNTTLPSVTSGSKYTLANIPSKCNLYLNAQRSEIATYRPGYSFTIGGVSPANVSSGAQFNLTNLVAFLDIPGNVTSIFSSSQSSDPVNIQLVLGTTYGIAPEITGLQLNLANANPSTFDLAATDPRASSQPAYLLQSNEQVAANSTDPVSFALPNFGSLSAGPFVGNPVNSTVALSINPLQGYFKSSNGVELNVVCQLPTNASLFSIPVGAFTS